MAPWRTAQGIGSPSPTGLSPGEIPDPEIFPAHGIGHMGDLDIGRPPPLAHDPDAGGLALGEIGEVDVDQHALGPGNGDQTPHDLGPMVLGHMPGRCLALAHLAERDGADAEQGCFHGRRPRSPESVAVSPRLLPRLTPESTRSGRLPSIR